ncbi:MAG: dTDP-4-dehydrorhamnose reductase [Rhodospirillaceae bacterium]
MSSENLPVRELRIAVTGKDGQVVTALRERGPGVGMTILPVGRPEMDLSAPETVMPALQAQKPDVIVSAAAYTAVDKAESEPELAFAINGTGAGAIAQAAQALDVPIIHLSTDYVFAGTKPDPYVEDDATGPLSVYGASKLEGEKQVQEATPNHVILRTAWVYSPFGNNFVKTMLRLAEDRDQLPIVADQQGRPTSALDIADAILAIAGQVTSDPSPHLRGVFHLAATGEATWAAFAEEIFRQAGKAVAVEPIPTSAYPTPAQRPANSRLDGTKLQHCYGLVLPDWRTATAQTIQRLMTA